ncbi:MAG TPA: hypothetical protein VGP46_10745 [Acidimicrobiales bacterium]|jgi:hypothetical protein|nr:hypothetical protein [Acidimicrobiales bacterium]
MTTTPTSRFELADRSQQAPKPPWHRRRAVLVGGAVALVVAFTIVSDWPQNTSIKQQVQQESTVIGEITTDSSGCTYAVTEALGFYHQEQAGTLTSSQKSLVPGYLSQDQGACSFTDATIVDLSNIEVPGSAAGRDIGNVVNSVTVWVTSAALGTIEAVQTLTGNPRSHAGLASLKRYEQGLASDRAQVLAEIKQADRVLDGAHLPDPKLPVFPT